MFKASPWNFGDECDWLFKCKRLCGSIFIINYFIIVNHYDILKGTLVSVCMGLQLFK